jgi:hypothetical protein
MIGLLGIQELLFLLAVAVIGVGGTVFWIIMLIQCATKEADTGNNTKVGVLCWPTRFGGSVRLNASRLPPVDPLREAGALTNSAFSDRRAHRGLPSQLDLVFSAAERAV